MGYARYRFAIQLLAVAGLFFVVGYSGFLTWLAKTGSYLFNVYADAELRKLNATGFVNPDGNLEYIVSVHAHENPDPRNALRDHPAIISIRPTLFDGWFVATVDAKLQNRVPDIEALSFVDFVLPNRGVWFCH